MTTGVGIVDATTDVVVATLVDMNLGGEVYRLSDAWTKNIALDSNVYYSMGSLIEVGPITNKFSGTAPDITVSVSGIPVDPNYTNIVLNTPIKGGSVAVTRAFLDPETLAVDNYYTSFTGIISSFSLEEERDFSSSTQSLTLVFNITPTLQFLFNQSQGQRTSPTERRRIYGNTDVTFDRVSTSRGQ